MKTLLSILISYLLLKLMIGIWIGFKISRIRQELFWMNQFVARISVGIKDIPAHLFDIRCDIREHFLEISRYPEKIHDLDEFYPEPEGKD